MSENSSSKLLRRYLAGSDQAPFELHERYQTRLIGLAKAQLLGVLKAKVDPDDISQEVFQAFFELADQNEVRWQKRGDLWRLLAGIAINKVKQKFDHYSAEKRNAQNEVQLSSSTDPTDVGEEKATASELAELVEHILTSEKPLTRSVVELRMAGFNHRQIAERIGRSTRTIRRVLESLKSKLIGESEFDLASYFQTETHPDSISTSRLEQTSYKDFQLLRMIGQGSFAKVYLAKQIATGHLFAIKAIRKKWLSNSVARQTFHREAEILKQFDHPNIVTCFGVGNLPSGGSFLLLEYVEGFPLERAARHATVAQRSAWAEQLTVAVRVIHASGAVHGDLCLNNIMVDRQNQTRIADFGLGVWEDKNANPNADLESLKSVQEFLASHRA